MFTQILIADNDAFRREYITSALLPLGAIIIGPTRTSSEACEFLSAGSVPDMVIMSDRLDDGPASALLSAVQRFSIPHLVLVGGEGPALHELGTSAVLREPFASFQVADWVMSLAKRD